VWRSIARPGRSSLVRPTARSGLGCSMHRLLLRPSSFSFGSQYYKQVW
jgi:hypothetical protein